MMQKTIKESISWEGIGLHSGQNSTVTLLPQETGYGIKFSRTDLDNEKIIPADVKYVSSTLRGTNLKSGDVEIMTVEHILSALAGLEISNILIQVDGPEIPILDGSSKNFVDKILDTGVVEQNEDLMQIEIEEVLTYKDEESGNEFVAIPSDKTEIEVWIDYPSDLIGRQIATYQSDGDFSADIAPARTFVFAEDLKDLADQGLIKGGDIDNAVVLMDVGFDESELKDVLKKLEKSNISEKLSEIKNKQLHLDPTELAKHKILDLLGDLRLAGAPIRGKIIAKKPGHTSNIAFAKMLKELYVKQKKLRGKPKYDPNVAPLYDAEAVKGFLPHRYPFLLVDKIIDLSDTYVVGVKNVTMNEQLFTGHFPDNPVFPGVLQMEALAQTGGILALNSVENPKQWDTYFLKMDSVKFKRMVVPGDTMIMKMELLSPIRRGIVHMQGTVYVGDNIVSEGELTAQIVKRPD